MKLRNKQRDGSSEVFRRLRIKITIVPPVLIAITLAATFFSIALSEYNAKMTMVSQKLEIAASLQEPENSSSSWRPPLVSGEGGGTILDPYVLGRRSQMFGNVSNQTSNDVIVIDDAQNILIENAENVNSDFSPASPRKRESGLESSIEVSDGKMSSTPPVLGANSSFTATSYVPIIVYKIDYEGRTLIPLTSDASLTDESFSKASTVLIDADYGFDRDNSSRLYYLKAHIATGYDVLVFTDVSVVDDYVNSLARVFTIVSLLLVIMITIVSWVISGWIVKPVKENWNKQKQFIADASHELKTPLSVIMANSSIILEGDCSQDDMTKWTESTQSEAENMNSLITDMLYLATNDSAKKTLPTTFNFSKIVMKTAMQFEARAFEKQSEIDYFDVAKDIEVTGDESALTRVVKILVDNACKYSHDNTTIKVSLSEDKRNALLKVENDGDGIPADMLETIFDRFVRVDKSRTGENGYGLGLAMAHDIVQQHNGKIEAKSADGHVTFEVKLPKASKKKS